MHPSSLGLHPVVYFYNMRGIHKIASYYSILGFIKYLEKDDKFKDFTKIRSKFEEIMIHYEYLVQIIVRRYRQSTRGQKFITKYYISIMDLLLDNNNVERTMEKLVQSKEWHYLLKEIMPLDEISTNRFSDGRKSNVYILEALKSAPKCAICGGYLHKNSITIDHKTRVMDGGLGNVENGQLAHPYCNSTYKN